MVSPVTTGSRRRQEPAKIEYAEDTEDDVPRRHRINSSPHVIGRANATKTKTVAAAPQLKLFLGSDNFEFWGSSTMPFANAEQKRCIRKCMGGAEDETAMMQIAKNGGAAGTMGGFAGGALGLAGDALTGWLRTGAKLGASIAAAGSYAYSMGTWLQCREECMF